MVQTVSQPRRPPPRAASAPRAACLRQHRLGPAVWSAPPPRAAPPRGPFRQTRSQSSNPPCRGPPAPTLRARQVPTTAPSRAKHTKPAGTPSQNPPQTRAGLVARLADKNWLGSVVGGPSSKMASSDGGDVGFRARWGGCAAAGRSQTEPAMARSTKRLWVLGCVDQIVPAPSFVDAALCARGTAAMAKSKNHTNHNQNYKAHRNGIKKPARVRWISTKGVRSHRLPAPAPP